MEYFAVATLLDIFFKRRLLDGSFLKTTFINILGKDDRERRDCLQGAKIVKSSHFLKMFSLGRKISLVCVATGKPRSGFLS